MLMQIPGIGPKRAMQFARELNVESVADLQAALDSGQVAALPRLGEKTAAGIARRAAPHRDPLAAHAAGDRAARGRGSHAPADAACAAVESIAPAGSIRRWQETTGDIDILVSLHGSRTR